MLADPIFWVMLIMMMCGATFGLMLISNCRGVVTTVVLGGAADAAAVSAAATTVTLLALFNALGRVACGTISDKIGRVNTLLIMLVLGVIGMFILSITGEGQLGMFRLGAALVGMAFGSFMGVYPGFCAEQFGPKNNGVNYGIMFIGLAAAGYFGPSAMRSIYRADGAYGRSFLVAAAFGAAGFVLTFIYRFFTNKRKRGI